MPDTRCDHSRHNRSCGLPSFAWSLEMKCSALLVIWSKYVGCVHFTAKYVFTLDIVPVVSTIILLVTRDEMWYLFYGQNMLE